MSLFVQCKRGAYDVNGDVDGSFFGGLYSSIVQSAENPPYNVYAAILSLTPFPTITGSTVFYYRENPGNILNRYDPVYSTYTVDGVTYYAMMTYVRSILAGETWNSSTWRIGADNYSDWASIYAPSGDVVRPGNIAEDLYNIWHAIPTTAYMDVDVYTTGADGNKIVTFDWKNIANIPEDMYPASYMVRVGVNYTAAPDAAIQPTVLSILPYSTSYVIPGTRDTSYQVGYLDALQSMPSAAQGYAISQGWLAFFVQLGHTESDTTVVDAQYLFKIEKGGEITDSTDPETGGNVDTHDNTNPRYNDDYSGDSGSVDASGTGQSLSLDNVLTTSYALTKTQLSDFGRWLWTNDLSTTVYGNEVSPIENILSCKLIPFDVASATSANIWVGNINSNVACVLASTNHEFTVGSITIDTPCGGTFLDEQNKISIYLPYCGIQTIPTGICYNKTLETVTLPNTFTKQIPKLVGRTLSVKYVFDMVYGTCAALLYMDNCLFGVYNGTCGVDIPLTQSNRASNQLALNKDGGNMIAGTITSGVSGAIGGAMSGGLAGAVIGGVLNAAQSALAGVLHNKNNAVNQETHFTTSGGFSSQIASFMSPNVTVFIEYTDMDSIPQGYGHENGFPCNLNLNMSDIVGYTELDGSIEISDIPCLEEERVLLKQALQEGFYL